MGEGLVRIMGLPPQLGLPQFAVCHLPLTLCLQGQFPITNRVAGTDVSNHFVLFSDLSFCFSMLIRFPVTSLLVPEFFFLYEEYNFPFVTLTLLTCSHVNSSSVLPSSHQTRYLKSSILLCYSRWLSSPGSTGHSWIPWLSLLLFFFMNSASKRTAGKRKDY